FIVSRFREERARGRDTLEAIGMSGATANRAVFFSGLTVVLALAGMLIIPLTIFRGLAGGAIIVVLVSLALSMTLLPALMALFADRLVKPGRIFGRGRSMEHGRPGGFWDTVTRGVMARPWVWLILAAIFMLALSVPYWAQAHPSDNGRGIKTGLSGISTIPDDVQTKQAFNVILAKFPRAGQQSSADVVIPGASTDAAVQQGIKTLEGLVANDPDFGTPTPPQTSPDGTITLVRFPNAGAATDAQSEAAVAAIARMRDQYVPQAFGSDSGVLVGGDSAFVKDFFDISTKYTPLIILLVLGLSFLLLTVVFRSVVVMVAVFAGFASGRLTSLEQMGFGLAVAVFLDATIVRSVLVPSAMKLLGDRNWYLPGWLQWLPKVDVEGHAAAECVTIRDTPAELVEARDSSD